MKVEYPEKRGYSPKNTWLEVFFYHLLIGDLKFLEDKITSDCVLPNLSFIEKGSQLKILHGISHGKAASILAEVQKDESTYYLGFFCQFETNKAEKLHSILLTKSERAER